MRTRGQNLYAIYSPGAQYSEREREHFNNVWNIQSIIPERLVGTEFDWIDTIWVQYNRTPSGGFILFYTVFDFTGRYHMYSQKITKLDMIDEVILFLKNNLINKNDDTN